MPNEDQTTKTLDHLEMALKDKCLLHFGLTRWKDGNTEMVRQYGEISEIIRECVVKLKTVCR